MNPAEDREGGAQMARSRSRGVRVRLVETAGTNTEAVARALEWWAILLADAAERKVVSELRGPAPTAGQPEGHGGAG